MVVITDVLSRSDRPEDAFLSSETAAPRGRLISGIGRTDAIKKRCVMLPINTLNRGTRCGIIPTGMGSDSREGIPFASKI